MATIANINTKDESIPKIELQSFPFKLIIANIAKKILRVVEKMLNL